VPAVPAITEAPETDAADQLSPTTARPISRGRAMRGSTLTRRPTSAVLVAGTRRFSPYPVQQRTGRSASPVASRLLGVSQDSPSHGIDEMDELGTDGDEDDLDFWGGRSRVIGPETTQSEALQEEEDERQDDLDDVMDYDVLDGGDEDDDNDHMEIFGHR
jgi:hypothetical protein